MCPASIEHQLDIHVLDLVESVHNSDILLSDVLAGIQYVMDYRIKGGKMVNLEAGIMGRLLVGLLQNMTHRTGNLLRQKFTPEADLSFLLFGQFLEEVVEFREAASAKSASDLQLSLMIHKRCYGSLDDRELTATILSLVVQHCRQVSEWKEVVLETEWGSVEPLVTEFAQKFVAPVAMATEQDKLKLFPPQGKTPIPTSPMLSQSLMVSFISISPVFRQKLGKTRGNVLLQRSNRTARRAC
jgi:Ca2+-transporting ATPase